MLAPTAFMRQCQSLGQNGCQRPCVELQSRNVFPTIPHPSLVTRRHGVLLTGVSLISTLTNWNLAPVPVKAEENVSKPDVDGGEDGVLGSIKSLFDPNERTKYGKLLPKDYLKSAREVVKTLRASVNEDTKDAAKFRRTADAAKESIRAYLNDWRGRPEVAPEESYIALEKAIRSLANFYSKSGPFAALPEGVKSEILNDLNTAEAFL